MYWDVACIERRGSDYFSRPCPSDGLSRVERCLIFPSPPEGIDESRTPRGSAGRGRSDAGVAVRNVGTGRRPFFCPRLPGYCRRLRRRRRVSVRVRPPRVGDRHPNANPPPGSVQGRGRGGSTTPDQVKSRGGTSPSSTYARRSSRSMAFTNRANEPPAALLY